MSEAQQRDSSASDDGELGSLPDFHRAQKDQIRLDHDGHISQRWFHEPLPTATVARVTRWDYWTAVASQMRFPDEIRIMSPPGANGERWLLDVLVLEEGPGGQGLHVMKLHGGYLPAMVRLPPLPGPVDTNAGDFEIRDTGVLTKWAVIRKRDGHVMTDHKTQAQCHSWLAQHLQTVRNT